MITPKQIGTVQGQPVVFTEENPWRKCKCNGASCSKRSSLCRPVDEAPTASRLARFVNKRHIQDGLIMSMKEIRQTSDFLRTTTRHPEVLKAETQLRKAKRFQVNGEVNTKLFEQFCNFLFGRFPKRATRTVTQSEYAEMQQTISGICQFEPKLDGTTPGQRRKVYQELLQDMSNSTSKYHTGR